ncbi:MAG: hypothetical protein RLP44_20690 [Aggregatilineales bacterium]
MIGQVIPDQTTRYDKSIAFISRNHLIVLNIVPERNTSQDENQKLIEYALMFVAVTVAVIAVLFRIYPGFSNALHDVLGQSNNDEHHGACLTRTTHFSDAISINGEARRSIHINHGQTITINVTATPQFDPTITLYAPDGTQMGFDDDSGGNLSARLTTRIAQDGIYVIAVREFAGRSAHFNATVRCS